MTRWFAAVVVGLAALLLGGCATVPFMPLADNAAKVEASQPLYLMSVEVRNAHKERWQPAVLNVALAKGEGTAAKEQKIFRMDDKGVIGAADDSGSKTFLVRFTTDGTPATLTGMTAVARAFPVIGFYFIPLHAQLPSSAPGTYYLGSVKAVIRERKDNEFRAGALIPLIDQAVSGASSGTFDIEIVDAFDDDLKRFITAYPSLKSAVVTKAVLPPWDRAKAQAYWDKN